MIRLIKTIDAHTGGQPLRLVTEGAPRPPGKTMGQRREWMTRHGDATRRAVVLPPRGHADLTAAILTEPASPDAHAGILFMDGSGYPAFSVPAILSAATVAIERGLFFARDLDAAGRTRFVLDTPAGVVATAARVMVQGDAPRVDEVAMTVMPAFVHAAAQPVRVGTRQLRVDVAFGGAFYAIVDSEATGIPLTADRLPELRRLGIDLCAALDAVGPPVHPHNPSGAGVGGVVFTGPALDAEAHLRSVTVSPAGAVDLSPGGGTAALMAVLDAMGLLLDGQPFVHEGLSGSLLRGRATDRPTLGDRPAVVVEVEGSAWITGEHVFVLDEDDPFREGIAALNR